MENKMIEYRLNRAISNLEKQTIKSQDTKTTLELAKLKLLKNDPKFWVSDELELLNQGKISLALISFIDKKLILPNIIKFFNKNKGE